MIGIYQIINKVNGLRYVGSSVNIPKRWNQHLNSLRKNKHHCKPLQIAFNKYGEINFEFTVIEYCLQSELFEKEGVLLSNNKLYNSKKDAHADRGENHPMFKQTHSLESRAKIKQARSKQVISHSQETRNKIGHGNKGRQVPLEHIKNMVLARGGVAWNKGIKTGISPGNKLTINSMPIIELYNSGRSIESIRLELKYSWDTINRILVENKIQIRTISQQKIINDAKRKSNK